VGTRGSEGRGWRPFVTAVRYCGSADERGLDDVLSEVTILAQVERIISADNESYQVIRMLKGGPASSLEKESVAGTVPEMLPALREIGVDIDMDDIFIEGPALILRAICAYR
jgi:hypothetical protein